MSIRTNCFNPGNARASRARFGALAETSLNQFASMEILALVTGNHSRVAQSKAEKFVMAQHARDMGSPEFRLLPYGTIANTRAGKPDPPFGLGKLTTARAPTSGT